ncbi:unnamed protein product, partial [Phaeothamnion confervicola]
MDLGVFALQKKARTLWQTSFAKAPVGCFAGHAPGSVVIVGDESIRHKGCCLIIATEGRVMVYGRGSIEPRPELAGKEEEHAPFHGGSGITSSASASSEAALNSKEENCRIVVGRCAGGADPAAARATTALVAGVLSEIGDHPNLLLRVRLVVVSDLPCSEAVGWSAAAQAATAVFLDRIVGRSTYPRMNAIRCFTGQRSPPLPFARHLVPAVAREGSALLVDCGWQAAQEVFFPHSKATIVVTVVDAQNAAGGSASTAAATAAAANDDADSNADADADDADAAAGASASGANSASSGRAADTAGAD